GIGRPYERLDDIRMSYQEALVASLDSDTPVKYRFFEDVSSRQNANQTQLLIQREQHWLDAVRRGDWPLLRNEVMSYIQTCEHESINLLQTQQHVLEFLWMVTRVIGE